MDDLKGYLARSKAGHDKGRLYAVVGEDREYVFLADGERRSPGNPKRKNKKHIQIIKNIPHGAARLISAPEAGGDDIKKALKLYLHQEEVECQKQIQSK